MKKMNFYSIGLKALVAMAMMLMTINLQAQISCVGGSPTAPGANFTINCGSAFGITADDVLLSTFGVTGVPTVTVTSLGGIAIANTGVAGAGEDLTDYIGKVVQVSVTATVGGTPHTCWGYVKIEDKDAPIITCPADIILDCTQVGSVNNLDVTGEFNGAQNRQGATGPTGTVTDCSKYNQAYTDVVNVNLQCPGTAPVDGIANVIVKITRTWTVKDVWGNTSAPCTQLIYVTRAPRIAIQFLAAPVAGSCAVTDYSPAALGSWPFYDANNNGVKDANEPFIIIGAAAICNVQNTGYTDQILPLCNGGVKIIRTWTIVDMCQTGAAMIIPVVQILTFTDTTPPSVSTTWQNYDQVTGTYCWRMYQNGTDMNMTQNTVTTKLLVPVTQAAGAIIQLRPLADANTCGMATVRFTMVASDPTCGNNNVTFSSTDSRVRFGTNTTNAAVSVAGGSTVNVSATIMISQGTTFSITVTDGCGNQTTQSFNVNIIDNVTPQTVCIEKTRATLGSDGRVRIFASTFNNGSSDNCGIERIQVRRMDGNLGAYNPLTCTGTLVADPCFYDYVDFGCADINKVIKVVVRAVDAAGNFSDCMVDVTVDDKTGPICMKPEDITRLCTDPSLSSYKLLFSRPAAFDNCGVTLRDSTISNLALNCGKGIATAVWTFVDCAGTTTSCSQTLTVNTIEGFRIKRICDSVSTCSATSNGIAIGSATYDLWLKNKILAEMSLLNGTAVDINGCTIGSNNVIGGNIPTAGCTSNNGTVAPNQKTCSAPVVEIEKWQYSSSQYCQIFRYRVTVIDFCNPRFNYANQLSYQGSTTPVQIGGIVGGACTNAGAYYQDDRGVVVFERIVYVSDQTAPVSVAPANVDSCIYAGCTFNYATTLTATDNCGGTTDVSNPAILTFMWRVINKATGVVVLTGNSANVSLTGLAFGTYTVCYRVSDLCANMSQEYCYDVTGKECKKPAIVCQNVNAEIMPTGPAGTGGEIVVPLDDLLLWATDNCTLVKTYLQIPAGGKGVLQKKNGLNPLNGAQLWTNLLSSDSKLLAQGVKYVCSDASVGATTVDVQVWAEDFAITPNADFCIAKVTLNNNMGACTNFGTVFSVSGAARTENNTVVNNVSVSANVNGAAVSSSTVVNGAFNLTLAPSANVQVRAVKNNNDDAASGVTTFDIAKVSQHVLDINKFVSPYKLIAADVDKSNEIDATDMLHMRRFILKITPSLPGGNFRFVDKAYTFRNAANPFGEDFPEVVNIATLSANTAANFVAVKLGDVNDSYNALAPRGSRTLSFNTNDMNVVAGNEYTVNIASDKMDAAAFQGTFSFNGATVKSVKAGSLNNMTDGNFGIFANAVTTSWNGKTQDASDVLAITFVANKSGKLSEMLTVNSALTQAVANDETGNEMNVNLKFNTGKVAGGEFALYQNQPNPVAGETTIGFNLPKDGQARLTITAVDGKVAKVINGTFKAGYNTISVNKSDLNASGVFYYRLETADHSASKKMVIIE